MKEMSSDHVQDKQEVLIVSVKQQHIEIISDANKGENEGHSRHKCYTVCPTLDYLSKEKIETDAKCTVANCDAIFSQVSALNFHMEKVHRRFNEKV
jgi:ferredoxin-like protein FixX